ncbi:hypothetical protein, partial [Cronobacter dublinensis]|uniref:hypothetical protein n=1 Tax=Cronobacter dublinensis TaxID=413497 RepID=UPI000CFA805A
MEGIVLANILRMDNKSPEYRYVRNKKQLDVALDDFEKYNYRYLHISAHGNKEELALTDDTRISFPELATILKPYSYHRRIFISACCMVNEQLATALFSKCEFYSVIGPVDEVSFSEAALFWSTYYHLMFKMDKKNMSGKNIAVVLEKLSSLFDIEMKYFHKSNKNEGNFIKRI